MILELQIQMSPEEVGLEEPYGICGVPFHLEHIVCWAHTDEREESGRACPECLAYLGVRNPSRFPTLADYEDALARYPEPMFGSFGEVLRLAHDDPGEVAAAQSASYIR